MNILLVVGRFPERSETFIYRKAVALAERGHRVTVAARRLGDWSLYSGARPATLTVEELAPDNSLRNPGHVLRALGSTLRHVARAPRQAWSTYELARAGTSSRAERVRSFVRHMPFVARRADVVHLEFFGLAPMYPLLEQILDVPIVVSCRGIDVHAIDIRPERERLVHVERLRRVDAIHCVSDEMARTVARLTGRTAGVWVNRPAVDTNAIAPRPRTESQSPVRVLAVGRLVWKKGFDHLLAAMARLVARGVDAHLDILGDGPLKSVLRFSIEDLGLSGRVSLAGAVTASEVLARMQHADIFVLSSHEEGISNAALEAMASGVPVVTTEAGGMAEAVRDGIDGYVVQVRDVAALADRIERLIRDPTLRATMGRAARGRAVAEFSLGRQVEVFERIYASVARPS